MSTVSLTHAEERLTHVAQQFAQWRQSRTTPRGRIPKLLWAQAVALASMLPLTPVAKQLRLTPQALKRRRAAMDGTPVPPHAPHFVEVHAAWRMPTAEVESQRPDGTRLRITYSEASPTLAPLLQTFLETR
ncbi:MAG TPA: hypothetical protein VGX03_31050 [Candidatus Binatia bacterium]|jgi:hypothetical protein|nr:hypothetical protein [Candidatus Binatia bacterium]